MRASVYQTFQMFIDMCKPNIWVLKINICSCPNKNHEFDTLKWTFWQCQALCILVMMFKDYVRYKRLPDLFRWIIIFNGGVIPFISTGYTKYSEISGLSSVCIRNWHDDTIVLGDDPKLSISVCHNYI